MTNREEVERLEAFEEVYRRYFADVYKYVLALSRDEAVAEEVTQETFFKALTAIDGFRGQCQLRVWLCQIARNQYLSLCRERAKYAPGPAEAADGGIEEGFDRREEAKTLHRLLHQLPEPYKEVFSLRTFGMTLCLTCCPCTTTACAQRPAGRRWRST